MELIIDLVKVFLIIIAGFFTYFKFFREGTHKQRIEFDIDFNNLGSNNEDRIIEIGVIADNKGNVEHKFKQIGLTIRGIKRNAKYQELSGHEPRVSFPTLLHKAKLINKQKINYYFVRPRIRQRFPITVIIPKEISQIVVKAEFLYSSGEFHIAERAFTVDQSRSDES